MTTLKLLSVIILMLILSFQSPAQHVDRTGCSHWLNFFTSGTIYPYNNDSCLIEAYSWDTVYVQASKSNSCDLGWNLYKAGVGVINSCPGRSCMFQITSSGRYVFLTANIPWNYFFEIRFLQVTGIQDNPKNVVNVFPNPTSDYVNISCDLREYKIEIFDNSNRIIKTINNMNGKTKFDLSGYSPGVYFIVVSANHQKFTNKIIKL
jgi:type IX secretion system substrate protein